MKRTKRTVNLLVVVLMALGLVMACTPWHHRYRQEAGANGNHSGIPELRSSLHLPASVQKALKLTMREHLEALQQILSALARDDYARAAALAHEELGFPKHHQDMQREQGFSFPAAYRKLAMAHHRAAEDLARVIPSRDMPRILEHLERTVKACVACHRSYKL